MGCLFSKPSGDIPADMPTERKPATNAASPETNISTASGLQVSPRTGTYITQLQPSGQAAEGRTMSNQQTADRHQTRPSTDETRPDTVLGGFNSPPEIPNGNLPASTNPKKTFSHEIGDLRALLSASGKRSKKFDAVDCTGKLTERTTPKFQGSFSDVSQAKLGDRVVAVKTLRRTSIKGDEESRIWKRLAREIHVWAILDHPNVLELLGFAIEDEKPCLISPWCDNGTLHEYLQRVPDANRRRLVREVAEGLKYLHEQTPPIIHGDLKPANVFVTGDHVAKISDFGSSRLFGQVRTGFTTSGYIPTTIRYSAPEILGDGENPTLCSDVFSFACLVIETMTDKLPLWRILNDAGIVNHVVHKKQTPSPEDHPGVEEAIWELLRKCWNYAPSARPRMVGVCKMLSAAGYGSSTPFYPPGRGGISDPTGPSYPRARVRGASTI